MSKILSEVKAPKFIVCLRNPIELAPSLHFQKLYSRHEAVKDFSKAWALSDERYNGSFYGIQELPSSADTRHMAYKHVCLLGEQCECLLASVEPSSVFLCFLEDIAENPKAVFKNLCNFLEIIPADDTEYVAKNRAKSVHSEKAHSIISNMAKYKKYLGIDRPTGIFKFAHDINRNTISHVAPDDKLVENMRLAFADDMAVLERVSGRDLAHWKALPNEEITRKSTDRHDSTRRI